MQQWRNAMWFIQVTNYANKKSMLLMKEAESQFENK